jgi:hypothetical protein
MTSSIAIPSAPRQEPGGTSALGRDPLCPPEKSVARFSPRVKLVPLAILRWLFGLDAEAVIARVDEARRAGHIRFAFDIGLGQAARELRFWVKEFVAPKEAKEFSIEGVIADILGARPSFPRGELEIEWSLSAQQIGRLLRAGKISERRHLILRQSLETFLNARWTGRP